MKRFSVQLGVQEVSSGQSLTWCFAQRLLQIGSFRDKNTDANKIRISTVDSMKRESAGVGGQPDSLRQPLLQSKVSVVEEEH